MCTSVLGLVKELTGWIFRPLCACVTVVIMKKNANQYSLESELCANSWRVIDLIPNHKTIIINKPLI